MNQLAFLEHLHALHRRLHEATEAALEPRGLHGSSLFLLGAVERCPYPTDLGQHLGLPAPSVTRLLKGLESEGYVQRETVPEDLRRYRFRLTPAGAAVRDEARARIRETVGALLERLSPEERTELDRLMGILAESREDDPLGDGGCRRGAAGRGVRGRDAGY